MQDHRAGTTEATGPGTRIDGTISGADARSVGTTPRLERGRISGSSLQGVASDMDGTLVETTGQTADHPVSWNRANEISVAAYGARLEPRHLEGLRHGATTAEVAAKLVDAVRERDPSRPPTVEQMSQTNEQAMADLIRRHGVAPMPGALALLDELAAADIPVTMVTASGSRIVDAVVEAMPEMTRERFAGIVTSDSKGLRRTKPEPDPYLMAAVTNTWNPKRVVALEDSETGVTAAEAAHMPVVHIRGKGPVHTRLGHMDVASLEQVSVDHLHFFGALNPPQLPATAQALSQPATARWMAALRRATPPISATASRPAEAISPPGANASSHRIPAHIRNIPQRDPLHTVALEIGLG